MEQKSMELDHKRLEIGNDSDRIALKDKLVDTYKKYKAKKYTKEQMLPLVPQLKEVIDAFEIHEHDEQMHFCTVDRQTHGLCVNFCKSVCCPQNLLKFISSKYRRSISFFS
jgi:hypothetical protein